MDLFHSYIIKVIHMEKVIAFYSCLLALMFVGALIGFVASYFIGLPASIVMAIGALGGVILHFNIWKDNNKQ